MTSAYHFMGEVRGDRPVGDSRREIELGVSNSPPSKKLTICDMAAKRIYALNSQRFDRKARDSEEDLESRSDWGGLTHGSISWGVSRFTPSRATMSRSADRRCCLLAAAFYNRAMGDSRGAYGDFGPTSPSLSRSG